MIWGLLSYTIPFDLPIGPNKTVPSLGIGYSAANNAGFSLQGTSTIYRCGANEELDGFSGGVRFDENDRYCLDGKRLIAISGANGADGTVYSSKLKNHSKVISHGRSGSPDYWEIRTKDGFVFTYGKGNNSQESTDSKAYRWNISSRSDRFNNTISYRYKTLGNQAILDSIDYSVHSVRFNYQENLHKQINKYRYGNQYTDNYLLNNIEIYTDEQLRRTYKLDYEEAGVASIQRLASLQLCDENNNCTKPTRFKWHDPDSLDPMLRNDVVKHSSNRFLDYQLVDVTGDGQANSCYIYDKSMVCDGALSSIGNLPFEINNVHPRRASQTRKAEYQRVLGTLQFIDLNHDGYSDYCLRSVKGTFCGLNLAGQGFSDARLWHSGYITKIKNNEARHTDEPNVSNVQFRDINDDQFIDICEIEASTLKCSLNQNGETFNGNDVELTGLHFTDPEKAFFVDIDGDSAEDVCGVNKDEGMVCYLNTRSGKGSIELSEAHIWSSDTAFTTENTIVRKSLRMTDFNADGLTDACYFLNSNVHCAINKGNEFLAPEIITSISTNSDGGWGPLAELEDDLATFTMFDMNNDALVDACIQSTIGTYSCALNTGKKLGRMQEYAAFAPMSGEMDLPIIGKIGTSASPIRFADINGDAKADVCYRSTSGISCATSEPVSGENLLKSIESAYNKTSFEYDLLTNAELYTAANDTVEGMLNLIPSVRALKSVTTNNAAGGTNTLSYQYEGLRYDLEHGMRSFAKIIKRSSADDKKTISHFHQSEYLNGRASQSEIYMGGHKTSVATYQYDVEQDGDIFEIRTSQTEAQSFDLDASLLTTKTVEYSDYDDYGNPKKTVETTKDELTGEIYTQTINAAYLNDSEQWILGKPVLVTTKHETAESTISKTVSFDYAGGILQSETTEPGDKLSLTTEYQYDTYGNKTQTKVTDINDKSRITTSTYDGNGYPLTHSNALNHTETLVYDKFCGQATQLTGPNLLPTKWEFDGLCRQTLETRVDGTSTKTEYAFSEGYDLGIGIPDTSVYKITTINSGTKPQTTYFDGLGNEVRAQRKGFNGQSVFQDKRYNARGLLESSTLPYYEGLFPGDRASWVSSEYDVLGRQTKVNRPGKNGLLTTSYRYSGNTTTITDPENNPKKITKDMLGRVVHVEEPDGGTVESTYDAIGNLTVTSINGRENSRMGYDIMGNKTSMKDLSMGSWSYEYNAFGELVKQTDAKKQTTSMQYDELGRLIKRIDDDEVENSFIYDEGVNAKGKLSKEISPARTTQYHFDGFGRQYATESNIKGKTFFQSVSFDEFSRPEITHYDQGIEIHRRYNENGYLKSLVMPKSQMWTPDLLELEDALREYLDKITELNDEAARYERYAITQINKAQAARRSAVWYANYAQYNRDTAKRLLDAADKYDSSAEYYLRYATSYRAHASNYYNYVRNTVARLVSVSSSGWAHYQASQKRGKNRYTFNSYLGGFFSKNAWPKQMDVGKFLNGEAAKLEEWANNYKSRATSNRLEADYRNKRALSQSLRSDSYNRQAEYYYNEASKLSILLADVQKQLEDLSGAAELAEENLAAYQSEVADEEVLLWSATSMDASDRLSGQVYGNLVLSTKKYNNLSGQLDSLKTQLGTSNILRDQLYEYDGNNSITRIEDKSRQLVQTYQYDQKDQLTDMTQTLNGVNTGRHYDYDGFGNMTEKSGTGSMAYNGKNQLTSLTRENNETVSYTYDANGNQVTGGRRTVQWTPFNKASQVVRAGNVTEYQYDANRNRAVQIVKDFESTETTWYVGGGYEHVEVKPVRGATVEKLRFNLYAGKELIGVYIKSLTDGVKDIDKLRFFHKDALGNVDLITDINGQEVSRSLYSPFGERTQTFGNATRDETRRGFTGHEHMDGVGLINMNARLYDPETGRFLSADTFIQEPQVLLSHNRYIYVWNNPLKYTDPSGHFVNFIFGAFFALVASQFENPYIRAIGMIVGGAMMAGTIGGSGLFGAGKSVAVANKLAAGFVMGGIQGGNLKGAILGAISAGMTYGIGHGADGEGLFGGFLETATAHGVFQGIIAEARGGTFASGFASGFIGHVAGAATGSIGGDDLAAVVTRTTIAAMFGGLAAEATGGSFEAGAFQAAMVHLFNKEAAKKTCSGNACRGVQNKKKFEKRVQRMLVSGHAGKGHRLSYREAIWWWQNAEGAPLIVDGRALTTDNWMSSLSGLSVVGPNIYDDVRVHGKGWLTPEGHLGDGMYDFDPQDWGWNPVQWARNVLTPIAEFQNGAGTEYLIQYRYSDEYFE